MLVVPVDPKMEELLEEAIPKKLELPLAGNAGTDAVFDARGDASESSSAPGAKEASLSIKSASVTFVGSPHWNPPVGGAAFAAGVVAGTD